MGDSLITIIAIFLAAILMFVFPMLAVSERTDDISQLSIQTSTTEFVDKVRTSGILTNADYDKLYKNLAATGNTYSVELEIKYLDENPGKKTMNTKGEKIGENVYYSIYTNQIEDELLKGSIKLKEGDIFSASVKNTNTTISQLFRNFIYRVTGNEAYQVGAQYSGIVMNNGGK